MDDAHHFRGPHRGVVWEQRHSHLLLRHVLFGLGVPDSAVLASVGLGRSRLLGDELSAIALVDACFVDYNMYSSFLTKRCEAFCF